MRLLSVDPGVRGCGCALWLNGELQRAEYVRGSKEEERAEAWMAMAQAVVTWAGPIDHLAIEAPRTYKGHSSKGDTQDLLDLSCVVGALCYAFRGCGISVYYPQEHKGQVPKAIAHARAMKRLSKEEAASIELPSAKSLAHNVFDAVQIGCSHLKRM